MNPVEKLSSHIEGIALNQEEVDLINEISRLYEKAEDKLKLIERIEGIHIPTINELRYTGYHLVKGLAGDSGKKKEELDRAIKHAKRSIYDVVETGITYYLREINNFIKDYKKTTISEVIPNYIDLIRKVRAAQNFIGTGKREDGEKEKFYDECSGHLSIIQEISESFELSREELNKKLSNERKTFFYAAICATGTVVAILVAITLALIFQHGS